jgi:hypothetical protein
MNQELSGLAKFLALVCVILLVITLPLALVAFDVGRVLFNQPLVTRTLTEEVVQSDFLPIVLEWFSDRRAQERVDSGEALTGILEPDIVLLLSFMDRNDWRQIKQEVLTDEILTTWTSQTVSGFYAWIDSDDRVPQITWSMQPFKDRVNTEHGANSIVIAYDNLPDCTQAEIDDFRSRLAAVPADAEVLYNLCRFPDPWHEDQFSDYVRSLQNVVNDIPPQFELTKEVAQLENRQGAGPQTIKNQLRLIRFLMRWLWLAPWALFTAIGLLVVRSWHAAGRWWGLPLVVSGAVLLLPALVYRPLVTALVSSGLLSEVPMVVIDEALRITFRLTDEVFRPMLIQAIAIILVGLLPSLVLFLRREKKPVDVD